MLVKALLLISLNLGHLAFAANELGVQQSSAATELATSDRHVVNLNQAIELGLHHNGNLLAKLTGLDKAQATEQQAQAAGFPKLTGTAMLSPIYKATGDAVHSDNNVHDLGVWVQSTITLLQPIYTWGKLSSLREAAARGSDVARAQARRDTADTVFEIKELFYGSVLAEQLYNFLEDGKNQVHEILTKTEDDQSKKRPTIPKREFYRLKIFAAEADYRFEEARKLRMLARHALSLKLGFDPNDETMPQETLLQPIDVAPPSENELVAKMFSVRPELDQLKNGIVAKKALLDSERANKYPMLFAGGMLTFAYSNVRTAQQSAFAYDPYNRSTGGAGIGVQWSWDFATTLANEASIKAEINELEKKQDYARSGFRMEIKKQLADLIEARARLAASKEAFQIGKRWLVSETMGYSVGLGEIKNLVDAYLARAKTTKDHWEAIYHLNMSWAELSKTIGTEITPGMQSGS